MRQTTHRKAASYPALPVLKNKDLSAMSPAARFVFSRLSAVLTVLFLGLSGGLMPTAALAYYPCNGPGPGEVLIGVDNTNGVQTPLCEYVGEDGGGGGYSDPGPSGYWVDRFAAIAWASDRSGNPTYSWSTGAGSFQDAHNGALSECASAGFSNCRSGPDVSNGALAIAVAKDGTLYADWGGTVKEAKRKTLSYCRETSKGCKIEQVLDSQAEWVSY